MPSFGVPMKYHVWIKNSRRRQYSIKAKKRISRWDASETLAIWNSIQAAKWYIDSNNEAPCGYKVEPCEGQLCGIAACRKQL